MATIHRCSQIEALLGYAVPDPCEACDSGPCLHNRPKMTETVAALHAIAAAIDGLAAAVRGERAKMRDDHK